MENKLVVVSICDQREGKIGVNIKDTAEILTVMEQFSILIAVLTLQITHLIKDIDVWNFKEP